MQSKFQRFVFSLAFFWSLLSISHAGINNNQLNIINLNYFSKFFLVEVDSRPVPVDFYVMSKCPFAVTFEQDFNEHVLRFYGLPQIIDLHINFIAKIDPNEPSGFNSLHGQTEVWGDIYELCIYNLSYPSPHNYTWYSLYLCLDDNADQIPDNVESCAKQVKKLKKQFNKFKKLKKVGLDFTLIEKCAKGPLGKQLMLDSIRKTNSLHWSDIPSPTIYINNEFYCCWTGSPCHAKTLDDFRTQICASYNGTKPVGCSSSL